MRMKPGESLIDWADRVQKYEYGYALQRLAEGDDPDVVFEAMAARIQQKLMHPIILAIKEQGKSSFDPTESKKAYQEAYLKKNGPKPDHLTDV